MNPKSRYNSLCNHNYDKKRVKIISGVRFEYSLCEKCSQIKVQESQSSDNSCSVIYYQKNDPYYEEYLEIIEGVGRGRGL